MYDLDSWSNSDVRSLDAETATDNGATAENELASCAEEGLQFSPPSKDASFICAPYKTELFQQQMNEHASGSDRRMAIICALQDLGIKVFVIDGINTPNGNTADVLHHVTRVVKYQARENRAIPTETNGPLLGYQRCLLYQDNQGRLFNLVLSQHATAPAQKYVDYFDRFSNAKALIALLVLCRVLPSTTDVAFYDSFQPALLALVLGFVLPEETSLSCLNTTMMVRAAPSVAAHFLMGPPCRDAIRKWALFCLVLAGAMQERAAQILTVTGVLTSCLILLANIGSRSWYFLRWKPLAYSGIGSSFLAYVTAVMAGAVVPFMSHRDVLTGGKAAMDHVMATAVIVAVAFTMTSIEQVQEQLLGMRNARDQNIVDFAVGIWWLVTVFFCLLLSRDIPFHDAKPFDSERFLIPDHASPSGFKVPGLPDYEINPALARTGVFWFLSSGWQMLLSMIFLAALGCGWMYLIYTNWDEQMSSQVEDYLHDL